MARRVDIETKTEELVLPIIEANNFELVDVEYVKEGANWYLRVYADKEGGIAIDDCVLISRSLEEKLDAEDFIEDAYILEVSSPGLGRPLNTTAYLRYAVSDLNGDGRQELTVLYSGEENRCMADCYTWDDRELSCISTLELSFSAPELSRVAAGALSDGQQALYVTGVADNSVAAYDILTVKNGVLRNVTQNTASSAVDGGFRFLSLYPTDIDGSGVIEIPEPIPFPPLDEESETYYRILWRDYDSEGKSEVVCRTFHNAADGWSLLLPETWDEQVSLLRAGTPDENAVLFFCRSSDGQLQPFLEICALTGSAREEHARRGDRFVLARQVETVYTAELLPCDDWDGAVDEETVKKSFSLIVAEWTTGEN